MSKREGRHEGRHEGKREMTEDRVERVVEQSMDALDWELMHGRFTQEQYDMAVRALDLWAKNQLDKIRARRVLH